ncbi:hypothetical protein [Pantoea sp. App145]|uniref:hypothetical protein n=1 Tax=Pantoea sp. App145 TaxID=3071567 RepID=UPI003A7F7A98
MGADNNQFLANRRISFPGEIAAKSFLLHLQNAVLEMMFARAKVLSLIIENSMTVNSEHAVVFRCLIPQRLTSGG